MKKKKMKRSSVALIVIFASLVLINVVARLSVPISDFYV